MDEDAAPDRQAATSLLREYPNALLGLAMVVGILIAVCALFAKDVLTAIQQPSLSHIALPVGAFVVLYSFMSAYYGLVVNRKSYLVKSSVRIGLFILVVLALRLAGVR